MVSEPGQFAERWFPVALCLTRDSILSGRVGASPSQSASPLIVLSVSHSHPLRMPSTGKAELGAWSPTQRVTLSPNL